MRRSETERLEGRVEMPVVDVSLSGSAPAYTPVPSEVGVRIYLNGDYYAEVFASPGRESALAVGLLFTDGVLDPFVAPPLVEVEAQADAKQSATVRVRGALARGVQTGPPTESRVLPLGLITRGFAHLGECQQLYKSCHGVHAAALVGEDGALLVAVEDVSRTAAIAKCIGESILSGSLKDALLLAATSRASYGLVRRIALAGLSAGAFLSKPTSLAVAEAHRCALVLASRHREGIRIYAGAERVIG